MNIFLKVDASAIRFAQQLRQNPRYLHENAMIFPSLQLFHRGAKKKSIRYDSENKFDYGGRMNQSEDFKWKHRQSALIITRTRE